MTRLLNADSASAEATMQFQKLSVFISRVTAAIDKKTCRSEKRLDKSTSREISASWRSAPRAASQPSFELHNIAASHATLSTQTNTRLSTAQTPPDTPTNTSSYFNPFPGKRTATAFYVRLDRKPQVLRYVDRISPLRQAQTDLPPRLDRVA